VEGQFPRKVVNISGGVQSHLVTWVIMVIVYSSSSSKVAFFGGDMHLKCNDILHLPWMDVAGKRFTDMNNDTAHSSETLTNWRNHIRQLYTVVLV
jgi:hypothetical protein